MSLGEYRILFEQEIPSSLEIQTAFLAQTGLVIEFTAVINVTSLCSNYTEVLSLLLQDAEAVAIFEERKQHFYNTNSQRYEQCAATRDATKLALKQFNHISAVQLSIPGFYEVEFSSGGKLLTLNWYADQYYAIMSLAKVLLDLGGQKVGADGNPHPEYPKEWKRLKKWSEYKWYNRPRK